MIEKNLRRIFRESSGKGQRRWGCLTEAEIATYADRGAPERERERIESHLDRCLHCREQVAFLTLLDEADPPETVPAAWLARARDLTRSKKQGTAIWRWRWSTLAAAAACLVLVSVMTLRKPRQEPRSAPELSPSEAPLLRGRGNVAPLPELIFPAPGATVRAQNLEFHWNPVAGAREYEISIVTSAGDLVWEQRTVGTSASPPLKVGFEAGHKYFVWIRAHLREDKTLQSQAVPFVISNP
jgi:putative zinc finger protein